MLYQILKSTEYSERMRGPLPYGISFGRIKNLIKVKFEKGRRKSWMKYAALNKQDKAQRLQLG